MSAQTKSTHFVVVALSALDTFDWFDINVRDVWPFKTVQTWRLRPEVPDLCPLYVSTLLHLSQLTKGRCFPSLSHKSKKISKCQIFLCLALLFCICPFFYRALTSVAFKDLSAASCSAIVYLRIHLVRMISSQTQVFYRPHPSNLVPRECRPQGHFCYCLLALGI